jgi:hypothetical protein
VGPVLPVDQIWFFKKLEIKILKKTRVHFKIFAQNGIKKIGVMCPTKFVEVKNGVETKKENRSVSPQNHSVLSKTERFSQKAIDFSFPLSNAALALVILYELPRSE